MASHHEVHLEEYIVSKLVQNGWVEGKSSKYDQQNALYPEDVVEWVKSTQQDKWDKLSAMHGGGADKVIIDRLSKQLRSKTSSTADVIRNGFKIAGAKQIAMSQSKPDDKRNEADNEMYRKNILRVVRQLRYTPERDYEIDLVFFVNGIPVATVELKTTLTGQTVENAKQQYRLDRLPESPKTKRKEPLLTKKHGAIVHFAMSDEEIYMATDLRGQDTFFLPFNKGNNGKAGNAPREDGEYPVAYFWEEVCTYDNWLRVFHNFVYTEKKTVTDKNGKEEEKEIQIFPRFHQLDCVNKVIADVKEKGAGYNYLNEHSAGSGKTSTIAWTAHDLINIASHDGVKLFDSVIVVTDRTVLDKQLQEAIQQLDHQAGVVCAIDKQKTNESKSKQLARALKDKTPIIIVTIQTFPHAVEAILKDKSLAERNFAVIMDEAHNSQTGSTAAGLRAALALESKGELENMSVEDFLLAAQKARKMPKNISHFAFTATPKHSTYMLFGRAENPNLPPSADNMPKSFHVYTQRQAIEEGFILDVLENYTPYNVAYRLGSSAVDFKHDKRVDQKMAKRALAEAVSLHPTNVTQKVHFIINHFKQNIAHLLNGEAKAMVVTSGRAQAVKYKLAFDKYIERNGIEGLKALIAFSGKVKGADLGEDDKDEPIGFDFDAEYSEYNMNPDAKGDLRHAFDTNEYQVMLVANKFQTGFNQPKLVAMYLDKKLSDIDAVQTLSRLNRTYAGKDTTYVIDFANDPETILAAFKKYDTGAELLNIQSLDIIYDEQEKLDDAGIYNHQDIDKFRELRGHILKVKTTDSAHKTLFNAVKQPADAFNSRLTKAKKEAKHWESCQDKAEKENDKVAAKNAETQASEYRKKREELFRFKKDLNKFVKTYAYVAQLVELDDAELENFAAFAQLLNKKLQGYGLEDVDVGAITLDNYHIKKRFDSNPEPEKEKLTGRNANTHDPVDREKQFLSTIINRLNDLLGDVGDDIGRENFANGTVARLAQSPTVVDQVKKNDKATALKGDLPAEARSAIVQAMLKEGNIAQTLLKDEQIIEGYYDIIYDMLLHKLRVA